MTASSFGAVQKITPAPATQVGTSTITRFIGRSNDAPFSAGRSNISAGKGEMTASHDEILFCLKGAMTVFSQGDDINLEEGDMLWIPSGNTLVFDVQNECEVFYVISPPSH